MPSNTEVIRAFVEHWSSLDAQLLSDYFTEDGTYYNMPAKAVTGKDNIEKFIAAFLTGWTETQWDIIRIAEHGDTVFCERLDRTKTQAGNVDLPCCGVFEMREGKIHVWRDYFDMQTFTSAMSAGG